MDYIKQMSYNISAYFIMPILKLRGTIIDKHMVNTYLFNNSIVQMWEQSFFIKMDYSGTLRLGNLSIEYELVNNPYYLFSYQLSRTEVVYCYKYPPSYKKDISYILNGQYSLVSKEYKSHFVLEELDEEDHRMVPTFFSQVFERDPVLREHLEKELDMQLPADIDLLPAPKKEAETI